MNHGQFADLPLPSPTTPWYGHGLVLWGRFRVGDGVGAGGVAVVIVILGVCISFIFMVQPSQLIICSLPSIPSDPPTVKTSFSVGETGFSTGSFSRSGFSGFWKGFSFNSGFVNVLVRVSTTCYGFNVFELTENVPVLGEQGIHVISTMLAMLIYRPLISKVHLKSNSLLVPWHHNNYYFFRIGEK